jgi:hypothetical protein
MSVYDTELAESLGRNTCAPLSDAGHRPPPVHFEARDCVMRATPPGARIHCELESADRSRVTLRRDEGEHIAAVIVLTPAGGDVTEETVAIASALYWSWWRAMDMRGEQVTAVVCDVDEQSATKG